jgi:hypothetical protein
MQLEKFTFQYDELNVKTKSLALAMGYSITNIPEMVHAEIDEVIRDGKGLCQIEGGYRIIENPKWMKENTQLELEETSFDIHKIIFNQIKKSTSVAVFACTAGQMILAKSRELINEGDQLRGYTYDVFGSIVVEAAMDLIQDKLRVEMAELGFNISNRYSPGYCGWLVKEQKKLFSLLPDKFCGISLTDSCLMQPIKSVSGIVGIGKEIKFNQYTCKMCDMENCLYRNLHQQENDGQN